MSQWASDWGIIYIECQYHADTLAEFLVSFGGATDEVGAFYLGRATGFDPLITLLRKRTIVERGSHGPPGAHDKTAPPDTGRDPDYGYDPRTRLVAVGESAERRCSSIEGSAAQEQGQGLAAEGILDPSAAFRGLGNGNVASGPQDHPLERLAQGQTRLRRR
jgi:hypothetical protein